MGEENAISQVEGKNLFPTEDKNWNQNIEARTSNYK